jgi:hypothetical protein
MLMYLEPIRPEGLTEEQWDAQLITYRENYDRWAFGMILGLIVLAPIVGFLGAYADRWLH